jgi:hypothetical protein
VSSKGIHPIRVESHGGDAHKEMLTMLLPVPLLSLKGSGFPVVPAFSRFITHNKLIDAHVHKNSIMNPT